MPDDKRFVEYMQGRLVRLFLKDLEFDQVDFVYILDCYTLGNETWLMVRDYDPVQASDFRIVRMSTIDTFEYFTSDEKEE